MELKYKSISPLTWVICEMPKGHGDGETQSSSHPLMDAALADHEKPCANSEEIHGA